MGSISSLNPQFTDNAILIDHFLALMHEHGTGGQPKYGIIPQMPLTTVSSAVNLLDNTTYSQPRVRRPCLEAADNVEQA